MLYRLAYIVFAAGALTACSSSDGRVIIVEGGPQISIFEGEQIEVALTIDPLPELGIGDVLFTATVGAASFDAFDRLEVFEGAGNLPLLALSPACDLVGETSGKALVPVTIEATTRTSGQSVAEPLSLLVLVEDQQDGACLPLIEARTVGEGGDCGSAGTPVPLSRGLELPKNTGELLCVSITSRDPANESLWIRPSTDAPTSLIASLPAADDVDQFTMIVPIEPLSFVVGVFNLDIDVYRGAPGELDSEGIPNLPVLEGRLSLQIGERTEWGIELVGAGATPIAATEFEVRSYPVRVWNFGRDDDPLCISAKRAAGASLGEVPVLELLMGSQRLVGDSVELCGTASDSIQLSFAVPIDSVAIETITIDVSRAGGCSNPALGCIRDVPFNVVSVADHLQCDGVGTPGQLPLTLCADLDTGDANPTRVLLMRNGLSDRRTCAYIGSDDRFTLFDFSTDRVIAHIATFRWQEQAKVVVLGQEAGTGAILELGFDGADNPTWFAAPVALDTPGATILSELTPAAQQVGARSTHYVFAQTRTGFWGARLQCIAPATCGSTELIYDTTIPDLANDSGRVVVADVDGDLENELVLIVTRSPVTPQDREQLEIVIIDANWTSSGSCGAIDCVAPMALSVSGNVTAAVATLSATGTTQDISIVTSNGLTEAAIVRLGGATNFFASPPTPSLLGPPGLAFGAASVQNRFVTGLASGAWELDETPAPGAWLLQDPVLLQAAGTGVIPVTALGYGRSLNACVTEQSDAAIVFSSSEVSVRYTHLDVAVDTP